MYKFETTHFHQQVRRSNVYCCISARKTNVETHLCNRKISCGTRQTYDNSEVRTPSRSLWSSAQKADTQPT